MSQDRERRTMRAMVEIYCRAHHASAPDLCQDCIDLYEYSLTRLGRCRFGPDKPVCAVCPIHCYSPDMRHRVREVMSYSGPRMALRHPVLAIAHLLQQRKPAPTGPCTAKDCTARAEDSDANGSAAGDGNGAEQ